MTQEEHKLKGRQPKNNKNVKGRQAKKNKNMKGRQPKRKKLKRGRPTREITIQKTYTQKNTLPINIYYEDNLRNGIKPQVCSVGLVDQAGPELVTAQPQIDNSYSFLLTFCTFAHLSFSILCV